jgi:hypothetical protein
MALDSAGGTFSPPPTDVAPSGYPVELGFESGLSRNRFWAIPLFGGIAKAIIMVPHIVILAVLTLLFSPLNTFGNNDPDSRRQFAMAGLAFLILWFPVLFGGRMPTWGYAMVGGYFRWSLRAAAFFFGLTDRYPPFTMHTAEYPVTLSIHIPESNNRWWAFPVVAYYIKLLILVPHYLCLVGLGVAAGVLVLVMWIPVLFSGSYPAGPYSFMCGVLRWSQRVSVYQAGLTDRYPPFSLS